MWLNFRPYFQINFLVCKLLYSIQISQLFVPMFSINYESALDQRVSLHQRGDRPLSQAIIIQCWPCFWTYVRISRPRVNPYRAEWILVTHDDVKRKKFPGYRPFVRGIHRSPVNSMHKGQWRGTLMFSSICARINGWVNNREAGDLRRHRVHYDVIVMIKVCLNFYGTEMTQVVEIFMKIITKDRDLHVFIIQNEYNGC